MPSVNAKIAFTVEICTQFLYFMCVCVCVCARVSVSVSVSSLSEPVPK
jgi:hypothetical protein